MVIYTKNPTLKSKVFKQIRKHENLAIKAYKKGKMRTGKKHETISDNLYAKNYSKMFGKK